jgi:hypothetical protein
VLDDVSRQYAYDLDIVEKLEQAKLHSGLILYIRAGNISSGITEKPYGDAVTIERYLGSLDELLRISHANEPNR